ncbi:hypothetical protein SELMODRAFT_267431 [Selaginella moellendorffii]|uniref:magnesium-protoporphyrin IX monomethyl ester (oxidative) cyclase n=1 Tax=Selaginella moellendorffii TaxID=88036 RepID=D8RHD5_SELML|nr:hypothetical protein SELMODRAFT_267431 [Selaginella moellendorffii]
MAAAMSAASVGNVKVGGFLGSSRGFQANRGRNIVFSRKIMASATKEAPRKGAKEAMKDTLLTPRFYTTDFDEMEQLFNTEINKKLNMEEFEALVAEFKADYNQTHFVRNPEFKAAADKITGPMRKIFVEFLERSCTAESQGFCSTRSWEEGSRVTRKYTFFKPQFIFYATYLSEKIGYWRYITIYRHLKANPDYQLYPIFKYFENWCQDENRHGDFFSALLKAQPQFLNDWKAKLWARFFCLSVYVTMYLNDCQRTAFYEGIGLDTKDFDMHVIIETNKTTARIFPAVLDVENPAFKEKLDELVVLNQKLIALGDSTTPAPLKTLQRLPLIAGMVSGILSLYLMTPVESGSLDCVDFEPQVVY